MEFKIKNYNYLNNPNIIIEALSHHPEKGKIKMLVRDYIRGTSNIYLIDDTTKFKLEFKAHVGKFDYYTLRCEYGLFLVREDNLEFIKNQKELLTDLGIKTICRNGKKTILVSDDGQKFMTTQAEQDDYDLEKAVMILLLKQNGYNINDIYKIIDGVK